MDTPFRPETVVAAEIPAHLPAPIMAQAAAG
jgi:hypothetical protein